MPGDPKECRLHSMRCAQLAATAKTPQLKATLLDLSENWVRLAESLEKTHALMDEDDARRKLPDQRARIEPPIRPITPHGKRRRWLT
jgi:hypothetical protein